MPFCVQYSFVQYVIVEVTWIQRPEEGDWSCHLLAGELACINMTSKPGGEWILRTQGVISRDLHEALIPVVARVSFVVCVCVCM